MKRWIVVVVMTEFISTACNLCRTRNARDEGFIQLSMGPYEDGKVRNSGFSTYCTDCYEMLRAEAAEDFTGFPPFYELVYEEQVDFEIPPELVVTTARDAFRLWRNRIDREEWLRKLKKQRAEAE